LPAAVRSAELHRVHAGVPAREVPAPRDTTLAGNERRRQPPDPAPGRTGGGRFDLFLQLLRWADLKVRPYGWIGSVLFTRRAEPSGSASVSAQQRDLDARVVETGARAQISERVRHQGVRRRAVVGIPPPYAL